MSQSFPMVGTYSFGDIGQKTKEIIIESLNYYFLNISQIGFPGSNVQSPIIREVFGMDIRNYPAIFVRILNEKPLPISIGQDYVRDVWSEDQTAWQKFLPGTENDLHPKPYCPRVIAQRYGYMSDITFNLQVWGDTTVVRNRIVDEIKRAFKQGGDGTIRNSLLNTGIVLLSISEGEEMDLPLNDTTKIFIANINLEVNAEIYFDTPVTSITGSTVQVNPPVNTSPDAINYIIND